MRQAGRVSRVALLAGAFLLGGCVYYNGMYNTNRMAKSARKAERDGRAFEAQGYWGQVVTKADSLVARHPRSKYADQATVLRGLALARLNQCQEAVSSLERLGMVKLSTDFAEEGALALGRCQLELGDPQAADMAFAQVVNSRDMTRRREARVRHARALRLNGNCDEALPLLREDRDPRGRRDLLICLAETGRDTEALAFADSIFAQGDTAFAWDAVIGELGSEHAPLASALVSRLSTDPRAGPELRAKRLYEDGLRLAESDSAAALKRFHQASEIAGATEGGERARLYLLRTSLSASRSLEELVAQDDSLAALAVQNSPAGLEAAALHLQITHLKQLSDSARPAVPLGDLRLFLGAEAARDSLHAPVVAASMFRQLADEWPSSPYAPKALLAAQQLEPADLDGTRTRLDSLYHDSPYVALVRGEDAAGYRVLEDSLRAFAATQPVLSSQRGTEAPGARHGKVTSTEDRPRRGASPGEAALPDSVSRPGRSAGPGDARTPRHGVEQ